MILNELAIISQRTVLFERFLKVKKASSTTVPEAKSAVYTRVKQLMIDYLIMEDFYIKKSVEKVVIVSSSCSQFFL